MLRFACICCNRVFLGDMAYELVSQHAADFVNLTPFSCALLLNHNTTYVSVSKISDLLTVALPKTPFGQMRRLPRLQIERAAYTLQATILHATAATAPATDRACLNFAPSTSRVARIVALVFSPQ